MKTKLARATQIKQNRRIENVDAYSYTNVECRRQITSSSKKVGPSIEYIVSDCK